VRRGLRIGLFVAVAAIVAVLAAAVVRSQDKGAFPRRVMSGSRPMSPGFDLPALSGTGRVRLADLRGSVVVVNFWASWCAPCQDEAPLLAQISAAERPNGVRFVGVDARDVEDDARAFVRRYGLNYPHGRDHGADVADRWGVTGYPETFVLDRAGRAVQWFAGPVDGDALRAAIAKAENS
jgi:cytochrome c biogenesis protein CcmG, thiol:disulfide interchange protein DsbE